MRRFLFLVVACGSSAPAPVPSMIDLAIDATERSKDHQVELHVRAGQMTWTVDGQSGTSIVTDAVLAPIDAELDRSCGDEANEGMTDRMSIDVHYERAGKAADCSASGARSAIVKNPLYGIVESLRAIVR